MSSGRPTHLLAIDQGTTSTRAILFDAAMAVVAVDQREFTQHFPRSGWVEHDAEEIWNATLKVSREAITGHANAVAAIGITIYALLSLLERQALKHWHDSARADE